ncbi:MAG: DUF5916 domain-containing protein [Bacteroidales bacterium]
MKRIIRMKLAGIIFLLFLPLVVFAQDTIKQVVAVRIINSPVIDGKLDEDFWKGIEPAKDFRQLQPYNGKEASFPSEVKIAYDDKAVYVGAMLFDPHPDSIMKQYSPRDEINVSDYFGVYFDPYNSGLSAYGFFVTPVNVQVDMAATNNGMEDENWNAVWKSEVSINEKGWCVEFKIPYSALRFPKAEVQSWGLNIFRNIARFRENTSWSFIDREKQGWIRQQGNMVGIKNVKPPLRLSFTPYLSTYIEKNPEIQNWTNFYRAGMDLKYGINESFTLDMMLVPDFGQVQSDNVVLNLSPFEVFYDEKRQFFIEGNELFNRANIFYSRRIGNMPTKYWEVSDKLSENEIIEKNPPQAQIINATKVSGRSPGGLGVGFLNAMTLNTYATIKDTISGNNREYLTEPFTNYNVVVFDQNLKNNSYASIINTNFSQFGNNYMANVTGTEMLFNNKKTTYSVFFSGAVNQIYDSVPGADVGYYTNLSFSKTSGQFRFALSNRIESDTYNPNDLGYITNPNEISNSARFSYNFFKPFGRFLNLYNNLSIWHRSLYNPFLYNSFEVYLNSFATFKNYLSLGYFVGISPVEEHDYFEARVPGRLFIVPPSVELESFFSTDFRKKIAAEVIVGGSPKNSYGTYSYSISFEPRLKPNDRLLFVLRARLDNSFDDFGYVDQSVNADTVYFGRRDVVEIENMLEARYIFNEIASLSFNLRHYWSTVDYKDYYILNEKGTLDKHENYTNNCDINFNYFTIDLAYRWIFAPGSELSLVWKNTIYQNSDQIIHNYFDNLNQTMRLPQTNSFSLRVLYYLDYQYLTHKKNS